MDRKFWIQKPFFIFAKIWLWDALHSELYLDQLEKGASAGGQPLAAEKHAVTPRFKSLRKTEDLKVHLILSITNHVGLRKQFVFLTFYKIEILTPTS